MNAPTPGFIGRSVERKEDARFLTGRGQYTDDIVAAAADLRLLPALAVCARQAAQGRHRRRAKAPGVLGIFTGERLQGRRRAALRLAHQQHRRHADEGAQAPGDRRRQGALRRRPRRDGRRRDLRAGQGRGGADRGRLRGAAGGGRGGERRPGAGAGARRGAEQPVLRMGASATRTASTPPSRPRPTSPR